MRRLQKWPSRRHSNGGYLVYLVYSVFVVFLVYKLTSAVGQVYVVRLGRLGRPSRRTYSVADRVEPGDGHREAAARCNVTQEDPHSSPYARRSVPDRADIGVYVGKLGELVGIAAGQHDDRSAVLRQQPSNQPVLGFVGQVESGQRKLLGHDDNCARPRQPPSLSLPFTVADGQADRVRMAPADFHRRDV